MTAFNSHQERLWREMLQSIDEFRSGKTGYFQFVGKLESALDAGEFRDKQLINTWYDHWTPLEIVRAQKGDAVSSAEVDGYIEAMKKFLCDALNQDII